MEEQIARFIGEQTRAVLATAGQDARPEAATILYAWDGESIVFETFSSYRKYSNLRSNPLAAMVISDASRTVQLEGAARELAGEDAAAARRQLERVHGKREWYGDPHVRFFRFTPLWARHTTAGWPPKHIIWGVRPLKAITDADIGLPYTPPAAVQESAAARGLIFDGERIALCHVTKRGHHKLPGGRMDDGETPEEAFVREVLEETGCAVRIDRSIGAIHEYRSREGKHQISHCFIATVVSKGPASLTPQEREAGYELAWATPEEALRIISSDQPTDYRGRIIQARDRAILEHAWEVLQKNQDE